MPKYVLPEGGRGSVGDLRGSRNHGKHRRGQHMNFAPYASRMGSSMQNLECTGGSGNSSAEEGELASRVFRQGRDNC